MTNIQVEVVYANEHQQVLLSFEIQLGSTVKDALEFSHLLDQFPELGPNISDLSRRVGIFGRLVSMEKELKEGDRIEIYRLLIRNPKELRRLRAKKNPIKKK
jgi:uncharacterized protein